MGSKLKSVALSEQFATPLIPFDTRQLSAHELHPLIALLRPSDPDQFLDIGCGWGKPSQAERIHLAPVGEERSSNGTTSVERS
jgi:hypothetical protein